MNITQGRHTKKQVNMLSGSLWDKLLIVAIPFAMTGIMQQLFNAADTAMLGQFVGKEAMAAVGSNVPIIASVLSLFIGISLGANVVIARFIGANNPEGIRRAVHTAVVVAVVSGLIMALAGELATTPILTLLAVPDEIFPLASVYLRIYLLGMPVILLYNFEAAIFRSQGDTRTPLYCLIFSGVIKFFLNLFCILVLDLSVAAVAMGTIVANTISSALLFYFLYRSPSILRLRFSELRIDGPILREILRIGCPAGLQGMVFGLSNICIQSAINSLGANVMAASVAAFNLEIFTFFIINAFGQVCTTFVSQNYGAQNLHRCKQVMKWCLFQDVLIATICCALLVYFAVPLLHIFNTDSTVIALGYIRMKYVAGLEVMNAFIEVISGAMRGFGSSLIPAMITLVGICGVRVLYVYTIFAWSPDFETLMIAFPVSWFVTIPFLALAYHFFIKHLRTA